MTFVHDGFMFAYLAYQSQEEIKKISAVAEQNITRLNINRKWFFEVLRDHARLYEEEVRLDAFL